MQHHSCSYNYCVSSDTIRRPGPWGHYSRFITLAINSWPDSLGGKNKTHPQGNSLTQLLPWKRNRHYSQLWRILVGSSKATEKAANPQKTLLSSCGDSGRPEGRTQDGPEQRSCGQTRQITDRLRQPFPTLSISGHTETHR